MNDLNQKIKGYDYKIGSEEAEYTRCSVEEFSSIKAQAIATKQNLYWHEIVEHICDECGEITEEIFAVDKKYNSDEEYPPTIFVCKKCFDIIDRKNKEKWQANYNKEVEITNKYAKTGIDVCRINYGKNCETYKDQHCRERKISNFMKSKNMFCVKCVDVNRAQLSNFSFGNNCLCGVPLNFAKTIQEKFPEMSITTDLFTHYFGTDEIQNFKQMDRVQVSFRSITNTMMGGTSADRYTVLKVNDTSMYLGKTKTSKKVIIVGACDNVSVAKVAK